MTLILTDVHSAHGIVQVSDRLTSQSGKKFDPEANKTVVFRCSDAVAVASFSGDAFMGGVPTDTWLARVLHNQNPLMAHPCENAVMGTPAPARWLSIGEAIQAIEAQLRATPPQLSIEIAIAGFRAPWLRRNGSRPFLIDIVADPNTVKRHDRLPRYWALPRKTACTGPTFKSFVNGESVPPTRWDRPYCIGAAGTRPSIEELKAFHRGLRSEDRVDIEPQLVEMLRRCADRVPNIIGKDCMSVRLNREMIRIRCLPFDRRLVEVVFRTGTYIRQSAYSPWILSRSASMSPQLLTGGSGWDLNLDGFPVTVETPMEDREPKKGPLFTATRHPRRRWP